MPAAIAAAQSTEDKPFAGLALLSIPKGERMADPFIRTRLDAAAKDFVTPRGEKSFPTRTTTAYLRDPTATDRRFRGPCL